MNTEPEQTINKNGSRYEPGEMNQGYPHRKLAHPELSPAEEFCTKSKFALIFYKGMMIIKSDKNTLSRKINNYLIPSALVVDPCSSAVFLDMSSSII